MHPDRIVISHQPRKEPDPPTSMVTIGRFVTFSASSVDVEAPVSGSVGGSVLRVSAFPRKAGLGHGLKRPMLSVPGLCAFTSLSWPTGGA